MHQPGEPREAQKRNDNPPQFSNQCNLCLHCAGYHQTATCMTTRQQQGMSMGKNITIPQNSPNTTQPSSSSPHSQISHPQNQSTVHIQMPTLNINAPPGVELTRLLKRSPGLMAPTQITVLIGWNKLRH